MTASPIHLSFDRGTLVVSGAPAEVLSALPGCRFDQRQNTYLAEARYYRPIVEYVRARGLAYQDDARAFGPTPWPLRTSTEPFPHQTEALEAWCRAGSRGVVVLPTGTGKTHVAVLAIQRTARPALVVVPTIDLLNQWYGKLLIAFGEPV